MNVLVVSDSEIIKDIKDIKTSADVNLDTSPWEVFDTPTSSLGIKNINITDYDLIFYDFQETIKFFRFKFNDLNPISKFSTKQFNFVFASSTKLDGDSDIYNLIHKLWQDIPKSNGKKGKKLKSLKMGEITSLLLNNKFEFQWKWAIDGEIPSNTYPLAKNKTGKIVSLIWKKEKTTIVFLPHPNNKKEYIEYILQNYEKIKKKLTHIKDLAGPLKKPPWIQDYEIREKKKLIKKRKEISKAINRYEILEKLLYTNSTPLENAVCSSLSYLGVKILDRTNDEVDLIFETDNKRFVAEIKGLKSEASEGNITQLFRWYAKDSENQPNREKPIKAIFICNPHRSIEPDKRKKPFHKKVINIIEGHEWGLLTTLELFNSVNKVLKGDLSKVNFISALENQIGIIKI